jgi:thioesterase domain-containing protein/acyl carrier protein
LPPRIGRPLTATRAYVVDRQGHPVPAGVAGELWLGGAGLARGYLGRPDLTAERFIPDPFSGEPGARLYRTGDLARWLPGGELEYLGRIDHQVKIRGFRIELGEIEAVLTSHPGVRDAVALAREDRPGGPRLAAYVVGSVEAAELREHLRGRLPEYMVPSALVTLEAFPLTPNGKIDRRALPAPHEHRSGQEPAYVSARDGLELELVRLWEEVLEASPISIRDPFFALGGHSLLAVRLVNRIAKQLGRELPLIELFQNPTIESLAERLRDQPSARTFSPVVALQASGHRRPFFCVHPGGGSLLAYLRLYRLLGPDRPFYGLQAWGVQEGVEPDQTIEAMAARYVAALREAQSAGPYLLGGWSVGGVVAYEMACQLREMGEEIGFVALIDARLPKRVQNPEEEGGPGLPILDPDQDPPHGQPRQQDALSERRNHLIRILETNIRALQLYTPRPFDGSVTLYRAAEEEDARSEDPLNWRGLVLRGFEVRNIPTVHKAIIREPAVTELAARLREDLP